MDLNALFDWLLLIAGFLAVLTVAAWVADHLPTPKAPRR